MELDGSSVLIAANNEIFPSFIKTFPVKVTNRKRVAFYNSTL